MKAEIIPLADYQLKDRAIEDIILLGICTDSLRSTPPEALEFTVLDVDDNRISTKVAIARVILALAKVLEML